MGDLFDGEADEGAMFEVVVGVLGVAVAEGGDCGGGFGGVAGFGVEDLGGAAEEDPPEFGPVVAVLVDEERGSGVFPDVTEAADFGGGFGFLVDGDVEGSGVEGEDDGDEVGECVCGGGGEMGAAGGLDAGEDGLEVGWGCADWVLGGGHGRGYQRGLAGSPP